MNIIIYFIQFCNEIFLDKRNKACPASLLPIKEHKVHDNVAPILCYKLKRNQRYLQKASLEKKEDI